MKLENLTFKIDASEAVKIIKSFEDDVAKIIKQRDELLDALRNIIQASDSGSAAIANQLLDQTRAAIAKATGEDE